LGILLPIVAFALAAFMLVPAALGLERYVITGGSMSGTYDRGSVVLDEVVPVSELHPGDVVTFQPPKQSGLVTHRIVAVTRIRGERVFRTKGDANPTADPWRIKPTEGRLPRVVASVPYVGYAIAALELRWVRVAAISVPAALIALGLLHNQVWRSRATPRTPPSHKVQGA
jgi:signal peptidase